MLGLVFNIGVLVAYSTITGSIGFEAVLLYIGCICWTLGYDTIYALQDIIDDKKAGIKSTALKFGKNTKIIVGALFAAFLLAALLVGGFNVFWVLAAAHFAWQVYKLNQNNPAICGQLFKSNVFAGLFIFLGLLLT
jgi:4-hydroxybenzoate polyprenyltransferase